MQRDYSHSAANCSADRPSVVLPHISQYCLPKYQSPITKAPVDPKPEHLQQPVTDEASYFRAHSHSQQLLAEQAQSAAECVTFNICGFQQQLEQQVLA